MSRPFVGYHLTWSWIRDVVGKPYVLAAGTIVPPAASGRRREASPTSSCPPAEVPGVVPLSPASAADLLRLIPSPPTGVRLPERRFASWASCRRSLATLKRHRPAPPMTCLPFPARWYPPGLTWCWLFAKLLRSVCAVSTRRPRVPPRGRRVRQFERPWAHGLAPVG